MKKKLFLRIGVLLLTAVLLILLKLNSGSDNDSTKYDFAMGTAVSVSVYGEKSAESIAQDIIDSIKKLDAVISWREEGSELAEVNSAATGERLSLSSELYEAIEESLNICRDSEGALDITLRPLLDCWNIENATEDNFRVPDAAEIEKSLEKTGYKKIETATDDYDYYIEKKSDVTIDLGATGKGYALDVVRTYLDENNVPGAVIAVGGSVMVYGEKSSGEAWKVGIRDPKGSEEDMVGYLEISDVDYLCVSTSGDYEKYIELDGTRYHHIMDRTTGAPARSGLSSVTVLCKSGIDSDGLSTACFVLGEQRARALLEKYNAEGLFIDTEGNITMTDGMSKYYVDSE